MYVACFSGQQATCLFISYLLWFMIAVLIIVGELKSKIIQEGGWGMG